MPELKNWDDPDAEELEMPMDTSRELVELLLHRPTVDEVSQFLVLSGVPALHPWQAAIYAIDSSSRLRLLGSFGLERGRGRPDLAGPALERVEAPTLLIVGGEDYQVIELNEGPLKSLGRSSRLEIIPGATHLFEEPGALDKVCLLARSWFDEYLIAAELESNRLIRYRRTS